MVLSSDVVRVSLHELQTVYGQEDLADLVEIVLVSAHNARAIARYRERED